MSKQYASTQIIVSSSATEMESCSVVLQRFPYLAVLIFIISNERE